MVLLTTAFRRVVTTSVVTATVTLGPVFTVIAAVTLNGAGATFPQPLYERYFAQIKQKFPDLAVNYQGIGSGGGIKQMTANSVDFAGSDAAMTDEEMSKVSRGVVFVPAAGGAIAVVYNAPGINNLKLSRAVLPAIFDGQIKNWNDPKIAADNAGVNLPNLPIKLVVRADSSGTTFNFTNHLSATDPYFKGRLSASKSPSWTGNPLKGKGNPGVAQLVKQSPGSIGYVESAYAKSSNLSTALVQNKQGEFVAPSLDAANQALESVQFNDDFRVSFDKLGDPQTGYPITAVTWLMVYKKYEQPGKADAVKKMVQWALTDGQTINSTLEYTRIPQSVAQQVIQTVNSQVTGP